MTSPRDPISDESGYRNKLDVNSIRWIALDGVGTLLFPAESVAVIYHRVGSQFGSQKSIDEIKRRFQECIRASEEFDIGNTLSDAEVNVDTGLQTDDEREYARWHSIVTQVLDDAADPQACFTSLFTHFGMPQAWRCHPETREVLPKLKQAGFRLALASNFDSRLDAIADGLDELAPVDARVISSLVGYRKPSRKFYDALIAQTGCRASEILMVGDDFENDIAGAQRAGLQAVHFTSAAGDRGFQTVASLKELAERLYVW